jgi:hypothetical protein
MKNFEESLKNDVIRWGSKISAIYSGHASFYPQKQGYWLCSRHDNAQYLGPNKKIAAKVLTGKQT